MASEAEIQAQREEDQLYEEMRARAKKYICAICNDELLIKFIGGKVQLKCRRDNAHEGFKPIREHPVYLERRAREMTQEVKGGGDLVKFSGSMALTQEEAGYILKTIWPEAPKIEVLKAALICQQYGLNPLMKQIYLVKYDRREKAKQVNGQWQKGAVIGEDWSIQLGIGATRMIARRSGSYSYEDNTPRIMTEAEQVAILGEVDKTKYWAITKLRDGHGNLAQGYGNWEKGAAVKGIEKGNTPQNMAFIRSERAALDKLFPEKLPAGIGVVEGEYEEVNIATGEILAEAKVQEDIKSLYGSEAKVVTTPKTAPESETSEEFPTDIHDWVQFRKHCEAEGFKISEVAQKLGRRYVSLAQDERSPIESTPENLALAWAAFQELKAKKEAKA